VTPGEDFQPEWFDLRQAAQGDACRNCGRPLNLAKTVEIGHIFKLGYKYSESMGLRVLNAAGAETTPIMGSYGIGIERILCAAVELYNDEQGMSLPAAIAPFEVVVTPVNNAAADQRKAAGEIYQQCLALGLDALLDDRDERPGVKFKDADLIGVPYRITVGKKLSQGNVEVFTRRTRQTEESPTSDAAGLIQAKVSAERAGRVPAA
jgi:prolyl-tRNA synthetase